jgi:hypothetical protein
MSAHRSASVRTPALLALVLALAGCGGKEEQKAASTPAPPAQHFISRPDLRPPPVHIVTPAHDTAPGYIFIAPKKKVDQAGPMILDNAGNVVWFHSLDTHGVTDFRAQTYRGRPVLTWWRGETAKGIGNGRYVIADSSYHVITNVTAGHDLSGDIHEFIITPRDTALFTVYRRVPYDLSALGGPKDGSIQEGVVQEVDIASGRVLFEWHSAPHVGVDESYENIPKDDSEPFDYFHINAIEPDRDGTLLVSARHTHTIYKIRRSDGAVVWRLGGKKSDFRLDPGASFSWQHDIRRQADGTLTIFDNAASHPAEGKESRVIVLRVDEQHHTAALVRSYKHHPEPLLSTSQGDAQFLPDGHVFVGWGSNEYFTEFAPDGRVLLDGKFGSGGADSYRAYRFAWAGHPTDKPRVAARTQEAGGTTVYASWNGATGVSEWRFLGGEERTKLLPIGTARKEGFETSVGTNSTARYFEVQALDRTGRVLATSNVVARP